MFRRFSPDGLFGRKVLLLAGGTAMGQIVVIVASPVITRLYSAEDFGYLALYVALVSLLAVVATARYHVAIPLPENDDEGLALVAVSAAAVVLSTAVITVALMVGGPRLLHLMGAERLAPHLWLIPIGILGAGTYQTLSYWAIRVAAFRPLAVTKLVQGGTLAAAQIAFGVLGMGPVGLMLGDALGRIAGNGTLAKLTSATQRRASRPVSSLMRPMMKRYRRFPLFSTGSALLNTAGLQLPAVLLLADYGAEVAGWYALTMRVVGVPLVLLGTAVSQVYTGSAAVVARESAVTLKPLFRATAYRLAVVGLLVGTSIALVAPDLFAFAFSDDWRMAGVYAQLTAPMLVIQFVAAPLSQTLNILEQQGVQLAWDASRVVAISSVLIIASTRSWTAVSAVAGLSLTFALFYALLLWLTWMAVKRHSRAHTASPS